MKLYRFFKFTLGWLFRLLYRLRITGRENLPPAPVLICANHTSVMDFAMVTIATPYPIHYMAKKQAIAKPFARKFLLSAGVIPIDREHVDLPAMRNVFATLKRGEAVGIFPQGTRRPYVDPRETEIKGGVGMIAHRAKVPVVPMLIKTKRGKLKLFHRTELIIGKPISFEELGFTGGGTEEYDRAARYIFDRVCDLGDGGNR